VVCVSVDKARRLKESVKWFALSEELLPKERTVLAAVSGGPDSMAMLSILHGLTSELGFRVAVAYFDHRIRGDGEAERGLVESFARSLPTPFYAGQEDVPALAAATGDSLEEAARKARYRFLHRLAEEIRADHIATAHNRDDQVETVLMRFIRGTGIRGLAGIPVRRGKIIRPLLTSARSETLAYCEAMDIPFIKDPTNEDTTHFRNRIRHDLLPQLKEAYNPAVHENLLRLAKNAQDLIRCIRDRTTPLIKQNLRKISPHEWTLDISRLTSLDDTAIVVLFGDVFSDHLGCDMDFSRVHYEQLTALVHDTRGSGKMLTLPGLTVKREYAHLILARPTASEGAERSWDYRATLTFPGETKAAGVVVKTEILERSLLKNDTIKATEREAYFDLQNLQLPLVLRNPETGDRMQPFGMTGNKKLSDIFTDKKIPGRKRSKSLVVADANEILWLVGVTTSEKSRVDPGTGQVVKITVRDEQRQRERR
jgi:tRNA(Ile)-lysidine synthase